jgi:hypothetical protein
LVTQEGSGQLPTKKGKRQSSAKTKGSSGHKSFIESNKLRGERFHLALPAYDASRNGEQPNPKQQAVNDTTEQTPREKCWYWNRVGGCPEKNCPRDHKLMIDEEKAKVPDSFWSKGRKGASKGQGSDTEGSENGKGKDNENRGKAKGEGKGPKIVGCRYTNNGEPCPHGEKCHWAWAHDKAHGPHRNLTEDL